MGGPQRRPPLEVVVGEVVEEEPVHRRPSYRNRSSAGSRTISPRTSPARSHPGSTPRMTAAAAPVALPITRSAALASSSTTATSVTWSSRPCVSVVPRRSTIAPMPAQPMATSVSPRRHGRPNVSDTITATSTPARARMPSRRRRADRSASSGRSAAHPASTLERSTPALAHTKPCFVSLMTRSPRRRSTRTDSRSTIALWASGSSDSSRSSLPSAFDTTFWVTTTTSPSASVVAGSAAAACTTRPARSSPGTDLGHSEDGEDREPSVSCRHRRQHPQARRPPTSGSRMIVSVTTQPMPSASTAPAECGVGVVDDERGAQRRVEAGDADDRRLVAELGEHAVGRALRRGAGDDRRDGDGPAPLLLERCLDAGHGEYGTDRHDRVRRRHDDGVGRRQRVENPGRGPRLGRAVEAHRAHGHVVVPAHEVRLEVDLGLAAVLLGDGHERPQPVVGRREQAGGDAPARGHLRGHLRQRRARGEPPGAVQVGAEVAVTEPEPVVAAVSGERGHRLPRLAGEPPAGLGLISPARVYVTVSRSGLMCRPWSSVSSPTLTMAVTSAGSTARTSPARNRAAPTPPARTATFNAASAGPTGVRGRHRPSS